jgi:hypothetical protein
MKGIKMRNDIDYDEGFYDIDEYGNLIPKEQGLSADDIYGREFIGDVSELKSADVIASGYEYICPHCDFLNQMIEYPCEESATCPVCKNIVELNLPKHALG